MDAYKTPDSNLETNETLHFKPIKAVLFGLLIAIVLGLIVSTITALTIAVFEGIDLSNQDELEKYLASNYYYLLIDILITFFVLYWAGTVVKKYVPGKEKLYAMIVTALTVIIIALMLFMYGSYEMYPIWYNFTSILSIPIAIYWGAIPNSQAKT